MRIRPGRHRPQFNAMRVKHDEHRKYWNLTEWSHWTDCDTCLAISVVDVQDGLIAFYESENRPAWQRAIFIAIVLACVAAVAVVGAGLVILPYLERARP